ncbi:MAG: hypothetical protein ABI741_01290 [Ferruginibacter sp.]
MGPVKKILDNLSGLHYRQEYLCLSKGSYTDPLHVYFVINDRIIKDITNLHLFTGYNPLIFAFPSLPGIEWPELIQLIFSHSILQANEVFSKKDALAVVKLKLLKKQPAGNTVIFYFEGTSGTHRFVSRFHQFFNSMNNRLFNKKAGNVFLHDNLYKQVQIAYAIPRNISLISISHSGLFNLFPTDLHGQIDDQHYIISLRIGGKACEQVEAAGQVLISKVDPGMYKNVYALGKNHMQPLKAKEHFPFGQQVSGKLKWPLPEQAVSYKELVLLDSFTYAIHKLFLFKIINQHEIQPGKATLAHIHNSYASWRYKNKLPGNYLLR